MQIQRSESSILFFSKAEEREIVEAIQRAELQTSGEIRLHLEGKIPGDPVQHAQEIFERIGMAQTEARNGVLILLGVASHRVVVLGDEGINAKVPENFWADVIDTMVARFKNDAFAEGLVAGIGMIGDKLQAFFPYERHDINELPDEISYSR